MIDARNRKECEEWGGEWVVPHIRHPAPHTTQVTVYVSAYCRHPRKGSRDYEERVAEFEGYDMPGMRRNVFIEDGEVRDPKTGNPIYKDFWKEKKERRK